MKAFEYIHCWYCITYCNAKVWIGWPLPVRCWLSNLSSCSIFKIRGRDCREPHCVGVEKLNKIIHVKCKQCLGQREHSHTISYYHKSYSCPISLCDSLLLWKVSSKNQNFFKACVLAGQISLLWKFGICWEWSSHCSLVPVFDMFNECFYSAYLKGLSLTFRGLLSIFFSTYSVLCCTSNESRVGPCRQRIAGSIMQLIAQKHTGNDLSEAVDSLP